jgi:hypothetical protein
MPTCSCCCTVMKLLNTPKIVALPTNIMSSQKLSCIAGQWYLVRTWRTITVSVIVESEDAILFLSSGTSYYTSREGRVLRCAVAGSSVESRKSLVLSSPCLCFFRVIFFLSSNLSVVWCRVCSTDSCFAVPLLPTCVVLTESL